MHRLVDVSRYQVERSDPLDLAAAQAAGYDIANVALTGGRGYVSGAWARTYLDRAAELGMGRSTYHWLDGRSSGSQQAATTVIRLRNLLGTGLTGFAHVVDVEEDGANGITPPTWDHVRTYVDAIQQALGRPMAIYTADYWWKPRGWDGASLTPYLMGPPNDPVAGDDSATSPGWTAGWGGWPTRRIMQWAVRSLPGTGLCSLSVIRFDEVWSALTEGAAGMTFAPDSALAVRHEFQKHTTLSNAALGVVGDDNHAQTASSYHLGESANRADSYTITESPRDRAGLSEAASANDIGWFSIERGGTIHDLRTFSKWLVAQCAAGAADTQDIREVIYSPDGIVVKRWDRLGKRSTGDDSHLSHTHVSWFRDSENRDRAAVIRRYFTEIEADMPVTPADAIVTFNSDNCVANPSWRPDKATNDKITANTALVIAMNEAHASNVAAATALAEQRLGQTAVLKAVGMADDGAAVIAAIQDEGARLTLAMSALPAVIAAELGEIPGLEPAVLEAAVSRAVAGVLSHVDIVYTPPA